MAILVDKEIQNLIDEGLITPSDDNAITSNGYDLLLEDFEFAPGEFKLIMSKEKVKIPDNLISLPFLRTTYAFKGLILSPGVIDAGFEGHLKFALYNSSKETIKIAEEGELKRAIHLIFLNSSSKADLPFGERAGEVNNSQ